MGELRSIYPSREINMKNKRVHLRCILFFFENYGLVL